MTEQHPSVFVTYAQDLFAAEKSSAAALKDHPQIPIIIDILSRHSQHHILASSMHSEKINLALFKSVALHLMEQTIPKSLRDIEFIYLDMKALALSTQSLQEIETNFFAFFDEIRITQKRVIIVINEIPEEAFFWKLIKSTITNMQWRLVILTQQVETNLQTLNPLFTKLVILPPSKMQLLMLLKSYKQQVENFHNVLIPDESFASALSLATHYLPNQNSFNHALELLDSAAARATALESHDISGQFKPVVTNSTLTDVISSWTHIPLSHLHNNVFQSTRFIETLQRQLVGQDAAIKMIGLILQHACINLQEKTGPLCSFLLAGPAEVGKTEVVYAMTQHLFGHKEALLKVNLFDTLTTISDVKIITGINESHNIRLLDAIEQTPYAVVLLNNIHQAPVSTLNLFKNIFMQGYAFDESGKKYDFSHAIIVMTTTLGADRINALMQTPTDLDSSKTIDLMHLVLNENPQSPPASISHLSPQELGEELVPALEEYFSAALLPHLNIVPFLPLEYAAFEKIIRGKVKSLIKHLDVHFGIELNYAPEVVKFLAHEAMWRKPQSKPLEKVLEEHLYSCVAHEILGHADDKNRLKRLSLQLNDNGNLLRCEFITANSGAIYT